MTETSPCPPETTPRSGIMGAQRSVSQVSDAAVFGWSQGKGEVFVCPRSDPEPPNEPYGEFEDDPDG